MEFYLKKDKCLICGGASNTKTSYSQSGIQSYIVQTNSFNTWKNECANTTCEILFQDKSEYFIQYFQDAEYCSVCEQLVRDACFIFKQLKKFQNQIEQLSTKMIELIDFNYQQLPVKANLKFFEERIIPSFFNQRLKKVPQYAHEVFVQILYKFVNRPSQNQCCNGLHEPDGGEKPIEIKNVMQIISDTEEDTYMEYNSDIKTYLYDENNPINELTSEIKQITQVGKEKCKVAENASIDQSDFNDSNTLITVTHTKNLNTSKISQNEQLPISNKSQPNSENNPQKKVNCPAANGLPTAQLLCNTQENNSLATNLTPSTSTNEKALPTNAKTSRASKLKTGALSAIRRKRRKGTKDAETAMLNSTANNGDSQMIKKKREKAIAILIPAHVTVLEGDTTTYKCNICMKEFKTKAHGKYHEFCVNNTKPFNCGECGRGFINKSHYQYHLRTHTGELPFECKECGKRYNQLSKMKRHMLTHIPYTHDEHICQECGKRFRTTERLNNHALIHSGEKSHECKCCKERFNTKQNLQRHIHFYTKKGCFSCPRCSVTFETRHSLSAHLKIHPENKKHFFACSKCSKSFIFNKDLRRHMRVHSGERPFKCTDCGISFPRKDNLTRHFKICSSKKMKEAQKIVNEPTDKLTNSNNLNNQSKNEIDDKIRTK